MTKKKSHPIHLSKTKAKSLGFWSDDAAADRAVKFFSYLRHSKGRWAGEPFKLLDWQRDEIIRPLFGWRRLNPGKCPKCEASNGLPAKLDRYELVRCDCGHEYLICTRRFRKGGIWVAKKNGKSTLSSGIALYMLAGDGEGGPEVFSAAADRAQASLVFGESANMVRMSPELSSRLKIIESTKTIAYHARHGFYKALSSDVKTKEGLNIHCLIFDELHVQPNRDMWDTLVYGGAARAQPLNLSISTSGVYDPESIGYEQYEYARRVLDGVIEDHTFFAYIAEAKADDDWKDPEVWRAANPSFGVTISEDDMAAECEAAKNSPAKLNSFLRYRLNIWTQALTQWVMPEAWQSCGGAIDWDDVRAAGSLWGGVDLATTTDICAWMQLWKNSDDYYCKGHYFIPEEKYRARKLRDNVPYHLWVQNGWVTVTPGNVVDYDYIKERILQDCAGTKPLQIGYDPWNATQFAVDLESGEGMPMVEVRQGYRTLSEPMKKIEKLILDQKLHHGDDPVLKWMMNNVVVREDPNENIAPDKAKSANKIDGVVALIIAMATHVYGKEETKEYVWTGGAFG